MAIIINRQTPNSMVRPARQLSLHVTPTLMHVHVFGKVSSDEEGSGRDDSDRIYNDLSGIYDLRAVALIKCQSDLNSDRTPL